MGAQIKTQDSSCDLYYAPLLTFAKKICFIDRENPSHHGPFLIFRSGILHT